MTRDPLGTVPSGYAPNNNFEPVRQYSDGMNLYEYVKSAPIYGIDPKGFTCCPSTTDSNLPDKKPNPNPNTRAHTIGEKCKYTGEWRVQNKTKEKKLSTDPLELAVCPTIINYENFTCECKIKCCDYDIKMVKEWDPLPPGASWIDELLLGNYSYHLAWVYDSSFYEWKAMHSSDWEFASYDDFLRDRLFAWKGLMGLGYGATVSDLNDEYQCGQYVGEKVGEMFHEIQIKNGIIPSKDAWEKAENSRFNAFSEGCKNTCQSKKDSPA